MSFRHPGLLWLLLALVPYAFASWGFLRRLSGYLRASFDASLGKADGRAHIRARALSALAGAAFWALATLAAADPSADQRRAGISGSGDAAAVVLDVSNSMLSGRGSFTRLELAKRFIRSIRSAAPDARWTLVAFKGAAVTLCPPTSDPEAFDSALSWADPGIADAPGSDLGTAILQALGSNPRWLSLLFVFSDGNDTGGRLAEAAKACARAGTRLVVFGAGTDKPEPVVDKDGAPVVGEDGRPLSLGLRAETLIQLAQAARGRYFRLDDPAGFSAASSMVQSLVLGAPPLLGRSAGRAWLCLAALSMLALAWLWSRPPARRRAVRPSRGGMR